MARNFFRVVLLAAVAVVAATVGVFAQAQLTFRSGIDLVRLDIRVVDAAGRPILAFTLPLIRDARSRDELAFVMGHEAAHHIAGHLTRQRDTAVAGAVLAGVLAQVSGGGAQDIAQAQNRGAALAARGYSKELELEADSLGAEIAYVAGFDPRLGAAFFDRLPDAGDQFLGTHPAHEARKRVVAESVARLGG